LEWGGGTRMQRFSRIVLGYHGCDPSFADRLIRGELVLSQWEPSRNPFDWLGHGIYFWEFAPERARTWGKGGVVGAAIQLGRCLDFTETAYTDLLGRAFIEVRKSYRKRRKPLPRNKGLRRDLD